MRRDPMRRDPMRRDKRRRAKVSSGIIFLPSILVLILAAGCSKEEMNQALETAKSKTKSITDSAVEAVEETLPETGEVTLNLKPDPIAIANAEIDLIAIGDGRPNVIQIATYDPDASSLSYPALLLHGVTDMSTTSSLSGQKILCDVYYQENETSPIAMTKPGEALTVTFQQYNPTEETLTATLGVISLLASDGSVIRIEGGAVLAVIREETE